MNIENIREVKKVNNSSYSCIVDLVDDNGELVIKGAEHCATEDDPYSDVFARIKAGDFSGVITDKPPVLTPEEDKAGVALKVRLDRDTLIKDTDWVFLPDTNLSSEKLEEWKVYRQALRDISEQAGFPYDVEWPVKPE